MPGSSKKILALQLQHTPATQPPLIRAVVDAGADRRHHPRTLLSGKYRASDVVTALATAQSRLKKRLSVDGVASAHATTATAPRQGGRPPRAAQPRWRKARNGGGASAARCLPAANCAGNTGQREGREYPIDSEHQHGRARGRTKGNSRSDVPKLFHNGHKES